MQAISEPPAEEGRGALRRRQAAPVADPRAELAGRLELVVGLGQPPRDELERPQVVPEERLGRAVAQRPGRPEPGVQRLREPGPALEQGEQPHEHAREPQRVLVAAAAVQALEELEQDVGAGERLGAIEDAAGEDGLGEVGGLLAACRHLGRAVERGLEPRGRRGVLRVLEGLADGAVVRRRVAGCEREAVVAADLDDVPARGDAAGPSVRRGCHLHDRWSASARPGATP